MRSSSQFILLRTSTARCLTPEVITLRVINAIKGLFTLTHRVRCRRYPRNWWVGCRWCRIGLQTPFQMALPSNSYCKKHRNQRFQLVLVFSTDNPKPSVCSHHTMDLARACSFITEQILMHLLPCLAIMSGTTSLFCGWMKTEIRVCLKSLIQLLKIKSLLGSSKTIMVFTRIQVTEFCYLSRSTADLVLLKSQLMGTLRIVEANNQIWDSRPD